MRASQATILASAARKTSIVLITLLPAFSLGCVQPPELSAAPSPPSSSIPPTMAPLTKKISPMEIIITSAGDFDGSPLNGRGEKLLEGSVPSVSPSLNYGFGPSGSYVCFWDFAIPSDNYCWKKTKKAKIFLDEYGRIQDVKKHPEDTRINAVNKHITSTVDWYYGPASSWCIYNSLGGTYCWE